MTQEDSLCIKAIRLPLIICVFFIHSIPIIYSNALEQGLYITGYSEFIFSQRLATISVPLFFIISGCLFFSNINNFSAKTYLDKLRSRIKTLLVPYIFWNAVVMVLYYITNALTGKYEDPTDYSFHEILSCFWGKFDGFPIAYQLWFLRDLIIMSVFTPLFYLSIKYFKIWAIIILLAANALDLSIPKISPALYFGIGAYIGINHKSIIEIANKFIKISCVISFICLTLSFFVEITFLKILFILSTIIIFVKLCNHTIKRRQTIANKLYSLSDKSFFLYVYHGFPIAILSSIAAIVINHFWSDSCLSKDLAFTFAYFAAPIIITLIGLAILNIMRVTMPKFTNIVLGKRNS